MFWASSSTHLLFPSVKAVEREGCVSALLVIFQNAHSPFLTEDHHNVEVSSQHAADVRGVAVAVVSVRSLMSERRFEWLQPWDELTLSPSTLLQIFPYAILFTFCF